MGSDFEQKKMSKIGTCVNSDFGIVAFSDVPYSDVNYIFECFFFFLPLIRGVSYIALDLEGLIPRLTGGIWGSIYPWQLSIRSLFKVLPLLLSG